MREATSNTTTFRRAIIELTTSYLKDIKEKALGALDLENVPPVRYSPVTLSFPVVGDDVFSCVTYVSRCLFGQRRRGAMEGGEREGVGWMERSTHRFVFCRRSNMVCAYLGCLIAEWPS